MKDVAILTKYYKNYNYGGMLQGYALHRVIEEMGWSCDIISYDVSKNVNPVYPSLIEQCKQYGLSEALKKVLEKLTGKLDFLIRDIIIKRKAAFDEFQKWVGADTEVYTDDILNKLNDEYMIFVSGSDQIWNPNAVRKLFLQDFVDSGKLKVAYAASIGRDALSDHEAEILIPSISRFDYLGIREATAQSLLSSYSIENTEVVTDPTMLLSSEQWEEVTAERKVEQPYALFYFFSDSRPARKSTELFCQSVNLAQVMIPYAKQEFNFGDGKGTCIRMEDVGPKEFVSAIKNADYVFTDSFHGAAFSIIFNKQFAVFERNKRVHVSMNSRLYDLLSSFGLDDRLVNSDSVCELVKSRPIDYMKVNARLSEVREHSLEFLRNSLGCTDD